MVVSEEKSSLFTDEVVVNLGLIKLDSVVDIFVCSNLSSLFRVDKIVVSDSVLRKEIIIIIVSN